MCGLSGIYSFSGQPVTQTEIAAQIETMVHRGPDQGGVYISPGGRCGLGIRRLSIIDVAGGDQPLHTGEQAIQLVYNGEIYNHRLLRAELEQLGRRPGSHSDGEAILHGYTAWGAAGVLPKLQGMFALALWDESRQQLCLARDRFGIKPLYYSHQAGRLYFASEIKAMLTQPALPRRVNLPALEALLTLGFVPGPETLFEGIYKLPPAHYLLAQAGRCRIERYWQLDYSPSPPLRPAAAAQQFLALLGEVVELHLMSEAPLGALLSGGLDSGTLVALLQAALAQGKPAKTNGGQSSADKGPSAPVGRLKTISIGFDQPAYDETAAAQALAQKLGTEHQPITFSAADFDDYPAVMAHLEEPQCSATALPIYKLYRACRAAGLTVVLTGEGADELLGGYHWHRGDALVGPLLGWPPAVRRLLAAAPLPMSAAARRVLRRGQPDLAARYQDWLEVGGAGYRHKLLAPAAAEMLRRNGHSLLSGWAEKVANTPADAPLHQRLWLESQTRLVDFINFEVDKLSMAHSIEARVPYLDHKLWEFCAGLPAAYKLKGGAEKYLLRQAARSLLPETTRSRRKRGLAAPYAGWLRQARLPDWAESALSSEAIRQAGLFEPAVVGQLRRAHQAGQPELGALLMGVLSCQVWFEIFMK
jgi:asparagine synthase (glutamine-hydrolysing)